MPTTRILITGHRGNGIISQDKFGAYSSKAPENSLAAMVEASVQGADAIEFDVRVTSDNVPVIIHDAKTDFLTTYVGNAWDGYVTREAHAPIQTLSLEKLQHDYTIKDYEIYHIDGREICFDALRHWEIDQLPMACSDQILIDKAKKLRTQPERYQLPTLQAVLKQVVAINTTRLEQGRQHLVLNIDLKGDDIGETVLYTLQNFYRETKNIDLLPPASIIFTGKHNTSKLHAIQIINAQIQSSRQAEMKMFGAMQTTAYFSRSVALDLAMNIINEHGYDGIDFGLERYTPGVKAWISACSISRSTPLIVAVMLPTVMSAADIALIKEISFDVGKIGFTLLLKTDSPQLLKSILVEVAVAKDQTALASGVAVYKPRRRLLHLYDNVSIVKCGNNEACGWVPEYIGEANNKQVEKSAHKPKL